MSHANPDPSAAAMSARVREIRKTLGLRQEQMASMLGVSPASVSYWERTGNIGIANMRRFSEVFGVSMIPDDGSDGPISEQMRIKRACYALETVLATLRGLVLPDAGPPDQTEFKRDFRTEPEKVRA